MRPFIPPPLVLSRLSLLAAFAFSTLSLAPAFAQRGDAPAAALLPAAESQKKFHLPAGFEIQLVAAEPELEKPFNLAFDTAGRVWVTGSKIYPWPAKRDALGQPIATFEKHWGDTGLAFRAAVAPPEPPEHGDDTLRVLSDFDPATGRARRSVVFAAGLNIPVGVLPLPRPPAARGDTVLVFSIPAIWRLTDTDGDGRADLREKLYYGFGFKDTHGMSSSYWHWFDGWVYGTHGFANASEVVDRAGRVTKVTSGATYRFRPDGSAFELYVHGQTNPYGLAFDARGDVYTADSHSKPVYLLLPRGYYEGIGIGREHDGLGYGPAITTDDHGSSAIAGLAHYSAAHFPSEFHANLFNGNPVTRRLNRTRLDWRGATPVATRQPDFLSSDDPSFRPVQVKLGSDGALWVADFYNPIIGHYEAPLTHPARDRTHGRLWRIVWRGLDRSVPPPALPDLAKENLSALVARLADPNLVVRSLAAAELMARPDAASAIPILRAALARLVAGTDASADATAALPLFFTLDRLAPRGSAHASTDAPPPTAPDAAPRTPESLPPSAAPRGGERPRAASVAAVAPTPAATLAPTVDALLRSALTRPDSAPAHAALRLLAARAPWPPDAPEIFTALAGLPAPGRDGSPSRPGFPASSSASSTSSATSAASTIATSASAIADIPLAAPPPSPFTALPGLSWRYAAEALARHPQPWGPRVLLAMLARAPETDTTLVYALRLALKHHALAVDAATLAAWAADVPAPLPVTGNIALPPRAATFAVVSASSATPSASAASAAATAHAERLADVCVAVPTAAAAEFLLAHLEHTKFAAPRTGDYAKHAVQHLPANRLAALVPHLPALRRAPAAQRLAFAEGLAAVAEKKDRPLPPAIAAWLHDELLAVATAAKPDPALALRALVALKPLPLPEKLAPLGRLAADPAARENLRTAALRALPPEAPETETAAIAILAATPPAPLALRRAAADALGTAAGTAPARTALAAAFAGAPADLALNLALALAKSDAGAADLLDLAAAGRTRPQLLRHRYVAAELAKRPVALRDRAATLTRTLPAEDARLDAVIAARLGAAGAHPPDAARGAPLFAQHCAACHRFKDTGGTLGPSLDGIGSRATARLVEDILDPSRNVDPAFRLTTVTLKNGDTRTGLNPRDEGASLRLTDPAGGPDVVVPRADIARTEESAASAMPAVFESTLTEPEFFDLLEYLRAPAR